MSSPIIVLTWFVTKYPPLRKHGQKLQKGSENKGCFARESMQSLEELHAGVQPRDPYCAESCEGRVIEAR